MDTRMPKFSLHNHSFYCGHGEGRLKDYVDYALENSDFEVFGFSEHCPVPDGRWPESRMAFHKLNEYEAGIRELKKNSGSLALLMGAECDWDRRYTDWYSGLTGERGYEYLIGSVHSVTDGSGQLIHIGERPCTKEELFIYTDDYIEMLSSGLFIYGAHPDFIAAAGFECEDAFASCAEAIARCAADIGIPLEINCHGFNKPEIQCADGSLRAPYPYLPFWEIAAQKGVKVVIGMDSHKPENVVRHRERAVELAMGLGLEYYTRAESLMDNYRRISKK